MKQLTLRIVTPLGEQPSVFCDSLHLSLCDDTEGKGGGCYGIRPGHAEALLALAEGTLTALQNGTPVFQARCGSGFATVGKDTVTVVAEYCE